MKWSVVTWLLLHHTSIGPSINDIYTVAAPLIAAASNQKLFFGQLAAASIQERPLIKK